MKTKTSESETVPAVDLHRLVRRWLTRALIGWWMVPSVWLIVVPLWWLLFGRGAVDEGYVMSRIYWNGE